MALLPFLQLCQDYLIYAVVVFCTQILTMKILKLAQKKRIQETDIPLFVLSGKIADSVIPTFDFFAIFSTTKLVPKLSLLQNYSIFDVDFRYKTFKTGTKDRPGAINVNQTRENLIIILIYIENKLIWKMAFLPFLQLCQDCLCYGIVVFFTQILTAKITQILTMKISKLAQ